MYLLNKLVSTIPSSQFVFLFLFFITECQGNWERHFCDNIKMGPGGAVGHPFTLGCVCMYMCMLAIEWVLATIDNCIHVLRSTTLRNRWRDPLVRRSPTFARVLAEGRVSSLYLDLYPSDSVCGLLSHMGCASSGRRKFLFHNLRYACVCV